MPYNDPLLTNLNGKVDKDISFEIESGVYAEESCGLTFQGEFYIYGSYEGDKRQIAKVTDCKLKRVADLPFVFESGACAATSDQG